MQVKVVMREFRSSQTKPTTLETIALLKEIMQKKED